MDLCNCKYFQNKFTEDLKYSLKLVQYFPNSQLYHNNLAATYNKINLHEKATYHAVYSLKLFPKNQNPFNHLAVACMNLN